MDLSGLPGDKSLMRIPTHLNGQVGHWTGPFHRKIKSVPNGLEHEKLRDALQERKETIFLQVSLQYLTLSNIY